MGFSEVILLHTSSKPLDPSRKQDPEGDTTSCILVGTTAGQDKISGSAEAMNQIIEHVDEVTKQDIQKGEKTTIQIQITDPQPKQDKGPNKTPECSSEPRGDIVDPPPHPLPSEYMRDKDGLWDVF